MRTNRLVDEKSPYLLQHARNPVDWYPWGEAAFEKARREEKPIFLSVGYSTCHWCHVMERESFESEEIAGLLNRHFVSVKVDREERPDVDRIYMTFVQAATGGGGWPMSVFLTPDLQPFFGGTYFPPDSRYGRPGFGAVLESIARAWGTDRERILESGSDIVEQLRKHTEVRPADGVPLDESIAESGYSAFRRSFDPRHGGFGGAPKFPRPAVLNFLLRHHARRGEAEALEMALHTLRAMAGGGMNDQIGGGFHRYSVDERWFVPHFEKMLYDQAQLAVSYLEGYQLSGDESLAQVARDIFEYVLRDMTHPEGGFYSAEDADSPLPENPAEKGEGAFFLWTYSEIAALLGEPLAEWFVWRYGVEAEGNVRNDPHEEFRGKNILFAARSVEQTADHFGVPAEEMRAALEEAKRRLLEEREKRPRPHLDDKILADWNGLMISAFAKGARVLGEPRYLSAAQRAADFVLRRMADPGGGLLRRYRDGEAAIPGFLDDYAFLAQAMLDLYEADFNLERIDTALRLTERMAAAFEDRELGGFFSTAAGEPDLVLRVKDEYDGAEPSGNSIAIMNLLRLSGITGARRWRETAERALRAFAATLRGAPAAVPQMLAALEDSLAAPSQVIIAGRRLAADTVALIEEINRRYLPGSILLLADEDSRERLAAWSPSTREMTPLGGKAAAYLCKDFVCRLPVTGTEELAELLQ